MAKNCKKVADIELPAEVLGTGDRAGFLSRASELVLIPGRRLEKQGCRQSFGPSEGVPSTGQAHCLAWLCPAYASSQCRNLLKSYLQLWARTAYKTQSEVQ